MIIEVSKSVIYGEIRIDFMRDTYSYLRIDKRGLSTDQNFSDARILRVDEL